VSRNIGPARVVRRCAAALVLTVLVASGCGGGGAGSSVPDGAKQKAVAEIGGSVESIYGEAVSTFGDEFAVRARKDETVYGILVAGPFVETEPATPGFASLDRSQFTTAMVVFDETGKVLETRYWVDARPDPPPFGKQLPKADAFVLDPSVYTGG
jgi:hypothetical protein